jgi:hypothetical protein
MRTVPAQNEILLQDIHRTSESADLERTSFPTQRDELASGRIGKSRVDSGVDAAAWRTLVGGYVMELYDALDLLNSFTQDGWHFLRPSDIYRPLEYTKICMLGLALGPLLTSAGSAPSSCSFS